jgi:hypothetical protein
MVRTALWCSVCDPAQLEILDEVQQSYIQQINNLTPSYNCTSFLGFEKPWKTLTISQLVHAFDWSW